MLVSSVTHDDLNWLDCLCSAISATGEKNQGPNQIRNRKRSSGLSLYLFNNSVCFDKLN